MDDTRNALSQIHYTILLETPELHYDGNILTLTMRYDYDEIERSASLQFSGVRGIKYTSNARMTIWHLESLSWISEVESSTWLESLEEPARRKGVPLVKHHYLLALDDFGALEVAANEYENGTASF